MSKRLKIIVAPYAKVRTDGQINAKTYPYWGELFAMLLCDCDITQLMYGNELQVLPDQKIYNEISFSTVPIANSLISLYGLHMREIERAVSEHDMFICVDNYLQHLAHYVNKPGIVLYGPSDPKLFGYPENSNMYVSEKYFRPNQFQTWQEWQYDRDAFVKPEDVVAEVNNFRTKLGIE